MDNFTVIPKWITFPLIHIESRSEHEPDAPKKEENFSLGSSMNWDPSDSTLNVHVILKNSEDDDADEFNREYNFTLQVYAVFEISDNYLDLKEGTAKELLNDVAAAVIGSLRERLTSLTSRSPWGAYILPILDSQDLAENLYNSQLKKNKKSRKHAKL